MVNSMWSYVRDVKFKLFHAGILQELLLTFCRNYCWRSAGTIADILQELLLTFCKNYCWHSAWTTADILQELLLIQWFVVFSTYSLWMWPQWDARLSLFKKYYFKIFICMISYFCLIVRCNPKAIHFRCAYQSNIIFTVYIHTTLQCNSIRPQGHKFRLNISHHPAFPFRNIYLVKTSTAITYGILFCCRLGPKKWYNNSEIKSVDCGFV